MRKKIFIFFFILLVLPVVFLASRNPVKLQTKAVEPLNQTVKSVELIGNLKEVFEKNDKYPATSEFGVYVLQPIGNDLFVGLSGGTPGNADGSMMVRYHDGLTEPVLNKDSEGKNYNIISEQGLHEFFYKDGKLYIAGTDPVENPTTEWEGGNFYTYKPGEEIIKFRERKDEDGKITYVLPHVLHMLGLWVDKGTIFAGTGAHTGDNKTWEGVIFKSQDEGASWEKVTTISNYRVWDIAGFNGNLYATAVDDWNTPYSYRSIDNGTTWQKFSIGNIGCCEYILPSYKPRMIIFNNKLIGVDYHGPYLFSINQENKSGYYQIPVSTIANWYNVLTTDNNYLYLFTDDNRILRSLDLNNWQEVYKTSGEKIIALKYWWEKNWLVYAVQGGKVNKIDLANISDLPIMPSPTPTPTITPIPTVTPTPTPTLTIINPILSAEGKIELSSFGGITIADPDGKNQQNFVSYAETNPFSPRDASWSMDGKEMAFVGYRFDANQFKSYWKLMSKSNPEGIIKEWLPQQPAGTTISSPHFSPDGQSLFFSLSTSSNANNSLVAIYKVTSLDPKPILIISSHPTQGDKLLRDISADGKKLMYYFTGNGNSNQNDDIFIANIDGSNPVDITNTPGIQELYPSFSPDGKKIIYRKYNNGTYDLYTMNTDGTNIKILMESADYDEGMACYSPDGKKIIYGFSTKATPYQYGLFTINADGSGKIKVMNLNNNLWLNMHCWAPDPNYVVPIPKLVKGWNNGLSKISNNSDCGIYSEKNDFWKAWVLDFVLSPMSLTETERIYLLCK